MATTTIQVPKETRDHLAELAKERGLSLGQLVDQLAAQQPTAAQVAERVAATRKVLRERMGCTLTDEEFDQGPDVLANVYALAAEKVHAQRGKAA
ncbi:hypothetical protein OG285_20595 [Streptomyces sp. NBC_01471]|uniref:hypothetical protein n=1 Tax=Streptomyces sp. NBC_01471 TaxID=2903879 RepID=UPI00324D9A0C